MKIERTPIELDKTRYLVYDMDAIYELEKSYGSFDELYTAIENIQDEDIIIFLQFGLKEPLEPETVDYYQLSDPLEQLKIKMTILQAWLISWPEPDPDIKTTNTTTQSKSLEWDWYWLYYMGTALLNMTEAAFWRCTPRWLFGLWEKHRRYNGLDQEQSQGSNQAQAFADQYL